MFNIKKPLLIFIGLLFSIQMLEAQIRIMPLGDSITQGEDGSNPVGGYRDDLDHLLSSAGINFDFVGSLRAGDPSRFDVDHEGHGGWRADQLLYGRPGQFEAGVLDDWLVAHPPDLVLLHIGTNDVSNGDPNSSTVSEIEEILDKIHRFNPDIKIFLSNLIPRKDSLNGVNDDLNGYIEDLYYRKKEAGYKIYFVDMHGLFVADPQWASDYLYDVVHPNNTGYALMARGWFQAILSALSGDASGVTLKLVDGGDQQGTAGRMLPHPLRVQALSQNGIPVSGIEVEFDPEADCGAPQPADRRATLFVEAEMGELVPPCAASADDHASGDAYISSPVLKKGSMHVRVSIKESGTYYFWGRVFSPSGDEDSFFFSVDDSPDTALWDTGARKNVWFWTRIKDRFTGTVAAYLDTGEHVLNFVVREANTKLDKILLTQDAHFEPSGKMGFKLLTDENGIAEVRWLLGTKPGWQTMIASSWQAVGEPVVFRAEARPVKRGLVLAGKVQYYFGKTPLSGVQIRVNGVRRDSTDVMGNFQLDDCSVGDTLTVVPYRSDKAPGSVNILSYDAALIARHAVGLQTLPDTVAQAADVDGDGRVMIYDAAQVARFAVGLSGSGRNEVGDWFFVPESTQVHFRNSDIDTLRFVGLIRGDVHGGWRSASGTAKFALPLSAMPYSYNGDTLKLKIPVLGDTIVFSFDLELSSTGGTFGSFIRFGSAVRKQFQIVTNGRRTYIRAGGFSVLGVKDLRTLPVVLPLTFQQNSGSLSVTVRYRINNAPWRVAQIAPEIRAFQAPSTFGTEEAYPNPFNLETNIPLHISEPGWVQFLLYDLRGRVVRHDRKYFKSPGRSIYVFRGTINGRELPSGPYFLRIIPWNGPGVTQKLMILK